MNIPPRKADFFIAGGPLRADARSYVKRPADDELFDRAVAGEFSYVLTCRQMGKSSLMNRTAQRLKERGIHSARIDLTSIGTVPAETWYLGLLAEITRQLHLPIKPEEWWQKRSWLGPVQRFITFLREVVLKEIEGQVVIFVDEIDTTLKLDFSDDFFAAIRFIYHARDEDPTFDRLNFILLGVASPPDLIKDNTRTPFNIGEGVILQDFSAGDATVLQMGLEAVYPGQGEAIFTHIYDWTKGHPYLTQRLCKEVGESDQEDWTNEQVDEQVERIFLSERVRKESNLKFVQDKILTHPQHRQLLGIYKKIYKGKKISDNAQSPLQNQLKFSGLVKTENGHLQVRNEIYRRVFNLAWVRTNTAINWAPIVAGIAIFIALLAVGSILNNAWVGIQVQDAIANFYQTNDPAERVDYLAKVFKSHNLFGPVDYDYKALELFYGLSREEQLNLFYVHNVEDADLTVVVKELYITLADTDSLNSTSPLLEAMINALHNLDETKETISLKNEISSWLRGRELAKQNRYSDALAEYNSAIDLNGENPATLYERARILIALSEYQQALSDLDLIVGIARRAPAPTATATPAATLTETPITMPTATPTTTPTATPTTMPTPSSSASVIATRTPPPTAIPTPASIISEFATTAQIISVVRNLIYGDPDLVKALANIPDSAYSNLSEFGLVPTPTEELDTPTATATLTPTSAIFGPEEVMDTPTLTPTPTSTSTLTSIFTPGPSLTSTPPAPTATFTFAPAPTFTSTPTLIHTPTFTPTSTPTAIPTSTGTPTTTPIPTFVLGLILRQTNEEVGTSKTWLLTSNNPIAGPFYDYGCLAYGEAFAYSGNKIYHKLIDNPDRRNSVRKALADQLGLDDEMILKFAEGKELDDKIFALDLSSNLGPPPKTNAHPTRGDFWIETMPSENPPFAITVTLSDSEGDLADPVTFSFEVTERNCSFSPTSKDGKTCYYDVFGHLIGCY